MRYYPAGTLFAQSAVSGAKSLRRALMLSRRELMAGLGATMVVAGFDPARKRWVRVAEAGSGHHHPIPDLDGVLLTDDASRAAVARDAGYMVSETPKAVLRP